MKHIWKIVVPLLLVAGIVWYISGRLQPEAIVDEAIRGTAFNAVTGTVEVFSDLDLRLKTERHGRLKEVVVELGDEVQVGDPIAVQESRALELRIEGHRLRLETALERLEYPNPREFDLESLESEVEATRLAVDLNQVPRSRLAQQERELEKQKVLLALEQAAQREAVALLRNELEQLELEHDLLTVRATFDGEIIEVYRFAGDIIGAGVDVARSVSPGRFLIMTLNEEDYHGVALDQRVTIRLASFPDRQFEGTVTGLAGAADSSRKTRDITLRVDNDEGLLAPGLTGEALLYKGIREDTVLVPRRALLVDRVYVIENGRVQIRRVVPGYLGLDRAEVLEGVEAGDTVVVENHGLLREGAKVRLRAAR